MDHKSHKHPAHVAFATVAIGLMAVGLAAGLGFLGIIERLDRWIMTLMIKPGFSAPVQSVDRVLLWSVTALLALSLAAVMLNISGSWRRLLIWALALILTLFWMPVLLLASHKPEIGVVLVGLLWSGCCAMVYVMNHDMPADLSDQNKPKQTDAPR
ncbi:MAG: hypothetical protein V4727_11365 [Verrucomicrobiota bacterium]